MAQLRLQVPPTLCGPLRPLPVRCNAAQCPQANAQAPAAALSTRRQLLATTVAGTAATTLLIRPALADGVDVVTDEPGSGTAGARPGDLLLLHYVGSLPSGTVFDSTLGGQMYMDGGRGALRPVVVRLGGPPMPGICAGLQLGIEGMVVGGRRTLNVPASLGFGNGTVVGPYGVVPANSPLRYEVELLRLSRQGPDALMSGVSNCGAGAVNERTAGCAEIKPAEFL